MKKREWYRLDNAAKIYPAISSSRRGSMFSLIAKMTEEIDRDLLNEAVNIILSRFPTIDVKLTRGVFWYYLEKNSKPFYVSEVNPFFLRFIEDEENNDYLFRVNYIGKNIFLTMFHCLSDGTGAMDVFKAIIFEYLILKGYDVKSEQCVVSIDSPFTNDEAIDNFLSEYNKDAHSNKKEANSFKTDGTNFDYDGMGIITGKVKMSELKEICKKYGVTVTVYLTALYLYSFYQVYIRNKKEKNKLIKLLVPANMRKWYPSKTIRNFALFIRPGFDFSKEFTFSELVESCKKQVEEGLTKENFDNIIYGNVKLEKNFLIKIVPLSLKDFIMRKVYDNVGDNLHVANLSNLGLVTLPESVKKYVEDFSFVLGTSFSCKNHLAVVGYNDHINLTFSREFVENNVEKEFFRTLTSEGIEVIIDSNNWEARLWNIVNAVK